MPTKPQGCGTTAAYQRHLRAGETACDDCKAAWAKKSADRYEANPEAARQRTRRYKKRHPEKVREGKRRYRENHAASIAKCNRKYYRDHYQRRAVGQSRYVALRDPDEIYQWFVENVAPLMKDSDF